jgi:hypothetical protein
MRKARSGRGRLTTRGRLAAIDLVRSLWLQKSATVASLDVVVMGAGRLGQSLSSGVDPPLARHGLRVVGVFDSDPAKIGTQVAGLVSAKDGPDRARAADTARSGRHRAGQHQELLSWQAGSPALQCAARRLGRDTGAVERQAWLEAAARTCQLVKP